MIIMVKFCPNCSNLLRKRILKGISYLICNCGFKKELKEYKETELKKIIQKKEAELNHNLIIVPNKNDILIYPKVDNICPKCGYKKAVYWQEQTLSADEPSTSFFRCLNCNRVWREY